MNLRKKTLEAQKTDRSEERLCRSRNLKYTYIFWGIVLFVVLVFFSYAIHIGQGELVGNIIEKIAYYIAGVLSSYGYCKYKEKQ